MKKYLEENIKFNTARFTSGVNALILLIAGEVGLLVHGDLNNKKILLTIFLGIVVGLLITIILLIVQNNIKEDIDKIKNYE